MTVREDSRLCIPSLEWTMENKCVFNTPGSARVYLCAQKPSWLLQYRIIMCKRTKRARHVTQRWCQHLGSQSRRISAIKRLQKAAGSSCNSLCGSFDAQCVPQFLEFRDSGELIRCLSARWAIKVSQESSFFLSHLLWNPRQLIYQAKMEQAFRGRS